MKAVTAELAVAQHVEAGFTLLFEDAQDRAVFQLVKSRAAVVAVQSRVEDVAGRRKLPM